MFANVMEFRRACCGHGRSAVSRAHEPGLSRLHQEADRLRPLDLRSIKIAGTRAHSCHGRSRAQSLQVDVKLKLEQFAGRRAAWT
jgi:hypothetical protein